MPNFLYESSKLPSNYFYLSLFLNSRGSFLRTVFPSATLVKDNTGRLPVHYVNDLEVKRLLMKASAPLSRAGITDSFSRFVT